MFLILNLQDVDLTVRLCLLELILLSEITLLPRIPINIVLFVVKSLYKATQLWHWHITIHIHTDRQTDAGRQSDGSEGGSSMSASQPTDWRQSMNCTWQWQSVTSLFYLAFRQASLLSWSSV